MTTYAFSLRVADVPYEGFSAFADALYSPDVDCTPSYCEGVAAVDIRWDAETMRDAIRGAIGHVLRAAPSARIVAVEADEEAGPVSLADAFAA